MAILNNGNFLGYQGSNGNVYPISATSGFIDVYVQAPLPQTYDIVYVQTSDYAASAYVTGSVGQKKTIKQYDTGASGSNRAILTTFTYLDTVNYTLPTKITESITTVS